MKPILLICVVCAATLADLIPTITSPEAGFMVTDTLEVTAEFSQEGLVDIAWGLSDVPMESIDILPSTLLLEPITHDGNVAVFDVTGLENGEYFAGLTVGYVGPPDELCPTGCLLYRSASVPIQKVPEPGSTAMLGLVLVCFGGWSRWKRYRRQLSIRC